MSVCCGTWPHVVPVGPTARHSFPELRRHRAWLLLLRACPTRRAAGAGLEPGCRWWRPRPALASLAAVSSPAPPPRGHGHRRAADRDHHRGCGLRRWRGAWRGHARHNRHLHQQPHQRQDHASGGERVPVPQRQRGGHAGRLRHRAPLRAPAQHGDWRPAARAHGGDAGDAGACGCCCGGRLAEAGPARWLSRCCPHRADACARARNRSTTATRRPTAGRGWARP